MQVTNKGNFPIEPDITWDIFDTSKLKEYCDCPRKFFYRYVLGWDSDAPNNHLVFGESMHRALAYLLQTDYSVDSLQVAYLDHFLPYYREHFPASTDELFGAKTPDGALIALGQYAGTYPNDLRDFEVLYVEVTGVVPVSESRWLHLRMDAVCRERTAAQAIFAMEHKTGSGINRMWTDQWILDLQPSTYTHALRCAFPSNQVKGTKINGIHFKKLKAGPKIEFVRVPVWKTNENMGTWLVTVNAILDEIERDFEMLTHSSPNDPFLQCFRLNPGSCTKYFGCQYHDYCCTWPNPLARCHAVPMGFKQEFWDPRAMEAKYQLSGEEIKEVEK